MKKISFVSWSSLSNVVLIVLNILTKQKDHKQVLTTYKFPSLCCTVEIQLRMCRKISKYWKSILIVRSKIVHCLADISISPLTSGFWTCTCVIVSGHPYENLCCKPNARIASYITCLKLLLLAISNPFEKFKGFSNVKKLR